MTKDSKKFFEDIFTGVGEQANLLASELWKSTSTALLTEFLKPRPTPSAEDFSTPQTPGHKVLTDEQVALVTKIKDGEKQMSDLVQMLRLNGADPRRIAIAATDIEKAFMMLVKAVTA